MTAMNWLARLLFGLLLVAAAAGTQSGFYLWRQVQVPFENEMSPEAQKAQKALGALEAEVVRQQRAAAQPKPRRYELAPQM